MQVLLLAHVSAPPCTRMCISCEWDIALNLYRTLSSNAIIFLHDVLLHSEAPLKVEPVRMLDSALLTKPLAISLPTYPETYP